MKTMYIVSSWFEEERYDMFFDSYDKALEYAEKYNLKVIEHNYCI